MSFLERLAKNRLFVRYDQWPSSTYGKNKVSVEGHLVPVLGWLLSGFTLLRFNQIVREEAKERTKTENSRRAANESF